MCPSSKPPVRRCWVAADLMLPAASPNRRVIVLDEDQNVLGLLCLNPGRTGFCGVPETTD